MIAETTRAIALIVEALRHRRDVRYSAVAAAWLQRGRHAEAALLQRLPTWERRWLPIARAWPRLLLRLVDLRIPGTSDHLLWRKLWFHHLATRFLSTASQHAGSQHTGSQIICLGAGLDPLGLRLAMAFPEARIVEFDRAAVMARKRAWLRDEYRHVTNLRCVPEAIEAGLPGLSAVIDPNISTLVLAEGLLMYLDADTNRGLLESIQKSCRGPLSLAFSCLSATALGDPRSPVARLDATLRQRGRERFRWAIEPSPLARWLRQRGFSRVTISSPPSRLPYGEFAVQAARS